MKKALKTPIMLAWLTLLILSACKKEKQKPVTLADLNTSEAINVGFDKAQVGGTIISNGNDEVTEVGVVFSKTNETPTAEDNKMIAVVTGISFTLELTNLDPKTQYYFRAYAINSVGTAYGKVISFTTGAEIVSFTYNGASVTYGVITSPVTGKKWLDRNLGAPNVPSSFNDYANYGDLFQWGRSADGHQLIKRGATDATTTAVNSTVEANLASSDSPGHSRFIKAPTDPYDWRNPQNDNLWQGVSGTNNPCPSGWRVPTQADFEAENLTNLVDGFEKLKLTLGGQRDFSKGEIQYANDYGFYWVTTMEASSPTSVQSLGIGATEKFFFADGRASASSIRCIKE